MLGIRIDVQKVRPQEYLTSGEQQPEASQIGDLIQDMLDLCQAKLSLSRLRPVSKGNIAVLAAHIAPKGQLKRAKNGDMLVPHPAVQPQAELIIFLFRQVAAIIHQDFTNAPTRSRSAASSSRSCPACDSSTSNSRVTCWRISAKLS